MWPNPHQRWRFWSFYSCKRCGRVAYGSCVWVAEVLSLSYTSRVGELGEMAGVFTVQTVVYKNKTAEITWHIPIKRNWSYTTVGRSKPEWIVSFTVHTWELNCYYGVLTLIWRSECDCLRCELLIKVPGVCLWCHLWFEKWGELTQEGEKFGELVI